MKPDERFDALSRSLLAEKRRASRYETAVILLFAAALFVVFFLITRWGIGYVWFLGAAAPAFVAVVSGIHRLAERRAELKMLHRIAELESRIQDESSRRAMLQHLEELLKESFGPHGPGDIP